MKLEVNLKENCYSIILERGILNKINEYVSLDRKVLIISDTLIPKKYYETVLNKCYEGYLYLIESGEESKNINNYLAISKFLLEHNFAKDDLVMAVGGGVVGDLSAFVASTYKRGIEFINIPTSSLAMIDSSVGGKTAINLDNTKNVLGSFYQPKLVLIDFDVLETLERRHLNNGLVEALKAGLLLDEEILNLFNNLEHNLEEIIIRSLKVKIKVIEQDEKENNLRKILNFGHTIGHALEINKNILHGEAVAQGMLYFLNEFDKIRVKKIIDSLNIKLELDINEEEIIELIKNDKKIRNNKIDVIVIDNINNPKIKSISIEEVKQLLKKGV